MKHISSAHELLAIFGMPNGSYLSPAAHTDTKAGFTIQRQYPTNIRFKPKVYADGTPDDVVVFWVGYQERKFDAAAGTVPLRLRAARMSQYCAKHFDFDFDDSSCPTRESIEVSQRSPQPLEVELNRDYFFSVTQGILVDARGNQVSGVAILDHLYLLHCKTVHPLWGLKAHATVASHAALLRSLTASVDTIAWLLKHAFGRKVEDGPYRSILSDGYRLSDLKRQEEDKIEMVGYSTSKRVVFGFAMIVALLAYLLLPAEQGSYMAALLDKEFLLATHALILLGVLDVVVPYTLFGLLNLLIKIRRKYFDWRFQRAE